MSIRVLALLLASMVVGPAVAQSTPGIGSLTFGSSIDSREHTPAMVPLPTPAIVPLPTLPSRAYTLPPREIKLATANSLCYAMRSYEFSRPDSSSEPPRVTGTTTCQPASKSHLKSTTVSPAEALRK